MNKFSTIDYVIFVIYFIVVSNYGYWVYSRKKRPVCQRVMIFFGRGVAYLVGHWGFAYRIQYFGRANR